MITYDKDYWGLPLLLRVYGSAFPRTWPFAVISGMITVTLELTVGEDTENPQGLKKQSEVRGWFDDPYPYQTFAFIVGFLLVFRANFGYQRYWEGRTTMQLMSAKWSDAVIQVLNFDFGTLPLDIDEAGKSRARRFGDTFVHLVSLLHGIAIQNLRNDWDLQNLRPHDQGEPEPVTDPRRLVKKMRGRRIGITGRFSWGDLLHLRSHKSHRDQYNKLLPLSVIGGVTEHEFVALGDLTDDRNPSKGSILSTGTIVPGPAERVQTVMAWVHQIILERRREGGLAIEPPIMTRVYQVLTEGMLGFEQARKLMDTPFPFPWAQFVTATLLLYTLTVPIVITAYITTKWLAFTLTLFAVMTYYALNEISRDLEDPFIYDPNDLPMARLQYAFNERILALSGTKRPLSTTELGIARLRSIVKRDTRAKLVQAESESFQRNLSRVGGMTLKDIQLFPEDEDDESNQQMFQHSDTLSRFLSIRESATN